MERFEVEDLGWVDSVDNPEGVSWVCFPGVEARDPLADDQEVRVPVSTEDLLAAGIDLTGETAFVWATVNIAAQQASEVRPIGFEKPMNSNEDLMKAWRGEC